MIKHKQIKRRIYAF